MCACVSPLTFCFFNQAAKEAQSAIATNKAREALMKRAEESAKKRRLTLNVSDAPDVVLQPIAAGDDGEADKGADAGAGEDKGADE